MMKHYGSRDVPVDTEVKSLLSELNALGYKTEQSCAGHRGKNGYVTFLQKNKSGFPVYLTKKEAKNAIVIARKHGCKRVGFPSSVNAGGIVYAYMQFSSMEKSR
jgi:hypothetical protein